MKLRKRGETETLSFLIGLIIFLLIAVPIGLSIWRCSVASSDMQKTIDMVAKRTGDLEDGQKGKYVGYIKPGVFMIAFEKGAEHFGGNTFWSCDSGMGRADFAWGIDKPKKCGNNACICACDVLEGKVLGVDVLPGDYLTPGACDDAECAVYDAGQNPRFYGGANCEYGPFITSANPIIEINYDRQDDIIGICENPMDVPGTTGDKSCISKDVNDARIVLNEMLAAYENCRDYGATDCICDSVDMTKLPGDHSIILKISGAAAKLELHDSDGPLRGERNTESGGFAIYDGDKDTSVDISQITFTPMYWWDESPLKMNFYANSPYIDLYKTSTGKVAIITSAGVKEGKEYCRIKSGEVQAQPDEIGKSCFQTGTHSTCKAACEGIDIQHGRKGRYCETLFCCETPAVQESAPKEDTCSPARGICKDGSCNAQTEIPLLGKTCVSQDYCCQRNACSLAGGRCSRTQPLGEIELAITGACISGYKCYKPANECNIQGGVCKSGCSGAVETPLTEVNCATGYTCCKPNEATASLLPSCADIQGTCRMGCDLSTESYEQNAECGANSYCCLPKSETAGQSECEKMGNECKAVSCENPELAASYTTAHAYDASCGSGRFCCKPRAL